MNLEYLQRQLTLAAARDTSGEPTMIVVTWQDPAGNTLDVCPACEAAYSAAGTWPRTEYGEYCSVSHGKHQGECQVHSAIKPPPLPACTLPPAGWTCSRPAGHDGPCAASPAEGQGT
jgi:hypothetical protein